MVSAQELALLLQRETKAASRLLQLLRDEHEALAAREVAAIERGADLKQTTLAELDALGHERNALIKRAGYSADKAGVEAYIDTQDPAARDLLQASWRKLLELAAECHRLNAINGVVIQSAYRYTQQALAILRGQPATAPLAYGPGGEVRPSAPSQTLAKA